MLALVLFVAAVFGARGEAKQLDRERHGNDFEVAWVASDGKRHEVEFALPQRAVDDAKDVRMTFPWKAAVKAETDAVKRYARTLDDVNLTVRGRGKGVALSASGSSPAKILVALKGGKRAALQGLDAFLDDNKWVRTKRKLLPDHPEWAVAEAGSVYPAARQLMTGKDARADIERALGFVQSIPYESRPGGGDKGFRPPVSVLVANRGDCDSKSTLLLAMVRSVHPDLDSAIVYTKGHAFVAFDLPPQKGDRTIRQDGRTWVVAEPVGPAAVGVGDAGGLSKRRMTFGRVEVVPLP